MSLLLFVLASFACDDLPLALPVAACHQFWHRRAFLYFRPHHDATIRCRYSLDRAIALCPPRDDSSSIFSGLGLRAMPPSRRFFAYPLGCASRYVPLATIRVANPLDRAIAQCPLRAIRGISSGPRLRAMSPSRQFESPIWPRHCAMSPSRDWSHILWAAPSRYVSRRFESPIFYWPRHCAMPPLVTIR